MLAAFAPAELGYALTAPIADMPRAPARDRPQLARGSGRDVEIRRDGRKHGCENEESRLRRCQAEKQRDTDRSRAAHRSLMKRGLATCGGYDDGREALRLGLPELVVLRYG